MKGTANSLFEQRTPKLSHGNVAPCRGKRSTAQEALCLSAAMRSKIVRHSTMADIALDANILIGLLDSSDVHNTRAEALYARIRRSEDDSSTLDFVAQEDVAAFDATLASHPGFRTI